MTILAKQHRASSWLFPTLLGLWVYLFLVLIGPFDSQPLELHWRAQLMLGYGIITVCTCWFTDQCLNKIASVKKMSWWIRQLLFILLFHAINIGPIYAYYASEIVLGEWPLSRFLLEIYLATSLVMLPFIIGGRWVIYPPEKPSLTTMTTLKGDNKLDLLRLDANQIIYLQSAQNYVTVHYYLGGERRKQLLRATLKRLTIELPHLVQIHRSCYVNPAFINGWSGSKALLVAGEVLAVSATYRPTLERQLSTRP